MRLTLGSVVAIFRDQLQLGRYRHQYDLMDTLLSDYLCEYIDYVLHPTAVSAWLHGRRNISAEIVGFYCLPGRDRKLAATIAAQILPHMPDRALAVDRIIALIRSDPTIHPATKVELLAQADDISCPCADLWDVPVHQLCCRRPAGCGIVSITYSQLPAHQPGVRVSYVKSIFIFCSRQVKQDISAFGIFDV